MARKPFEVFRPEELAYCKALIFGIHGAGKTRLMGTALDDPRTDPMLFLAFEAGTQTLVGRDIDVRPIGSWADFNECYAFLSGPDNIYKSVAIDSISEVQIEGMLQILDKKSKDKSEDFTQPDWGTILVQMRRFVRTFKDLPMHVFFTALAKDDVMPRVGAVKVPLLQGSFQAELPGIVDTVAYLAVEELDDGSNQRVLLLHNNPRFSVKARAPWDAVIPEEIVEPTIGKLLDALGFAA